MSRQEVFAHALLDPDRARPAALQGRDGTQAVKRFDVYRNNVVASLIAALEDGFPVVRALVGEEFFGGMADVFVRRHPPRSPRLMLYGAALPGFLRAFPPVAHLPYLPDVARLELALRESYHAADATPVGPDALAALSPAALAETRIALAPSLRLMRSDWPVAAIWHAHHGGPKPAPGPQEVLIARPGFDPVPHVLPPGGHALIAALIAGRTLGEALAETPEGFAEAGLPAVLGLLLQTQALCGLDTGDMR